MNFGCDERVINEMENKWKVENEKKVELFVCDERGVKERENVTLILLIFIVEWGKWIIIMGS